MVYPHATLPHDGRRLPHCAAVRFHHGVARMIQRRHFLKSATLGAIASSVAGWG
ncbi:N(4)-(beta-N-acetylglucosaminyl)-L-asparaginase, partial [Xanthomonas oryzae pv. oryzae]